MTRNQARVVWTDDPTADLRDALAALDEENRKAIRQHGAPPPWPLTPGTPRHVIDAARRLLATADLTPADVWPAHLTTLAGYHATVHEDGTVTPADPTPQTDTDGGTHGD